MMEKSAQGPPQHQSAVSASEDAPATCIPPKLVTRQRLEPRLFPPQ